MPPGAHNIEMVERRQFSLKSSSAVNVLELMASADSNHDGSLLRLERDEVHVWYVGVDEVGDPCPADDEKTLSLDEQSRGARFVFEKDRRLYLAAHVLARSVLSKYAAVAPSEWRFESEPGGKPRISGPAGVPALRFNLSHTHGLAAVAVTLDDEIGVDVERITSPVDMDLARNCFSPGEIAWLDSTPAAEQPNRFFEIWTLKEAYLKARGTGLSLPLKEFSVCAMGDVAATISFCGSIVDDPAAWQFHRSQITPQHQLAVAVRRPTASPLRLSLREWPARWNGGR